MAGLTDISLANYTRMAMGAAGGTADPSTAADLIKNIQSIGELSDESTIVDVPEYGRRYLRKLVGSASAGPIDLVCNFHAGDTSYAKLQTAYKLGTRHKFWLQMTDASGTTGDQVAFVGIVASKSFSNEFDATRTVTWSIAIDGEVSDVADMTALSRKGETKPSVK